MPPPWLVKGIVGVQDLDIPTRVRSDPPGSAPSDLPIRNLDDSPPN